MSDEPEINKNRMIPLHVANQAVRALEEEILRVRAELERTQAEVARLESFCTRTIIPNETLQAEVERLNKLAQYFPKPPAAKDGKPSV